MRLPHALTAQSARLLPSAAASASAAAATAAAATASGRSRCISPCRHRHFSQCHISGSRRILEHTRILRDGSATAAAARPAWGRRRQGLHHTARRRIHEKQPQQTDAERTGSGGNSSSPTEPAKDQALPAPPEKHEPAVALDVGGPGVKLDYLGPLVVNRDGTTGRVANWAEMTENERQTTLKLLTRRNKQRLEVLKQEQSDVKHDK